MVTCCPIVDSPQSNVAVVSLGASMEVVLIVAALTEALSRNDPALAWSDDSARTVARPTVANRGLPPHARAAPAARDRVLGADHERTAGAAATGAGVAGDAGAGMVGGAGAGMVGGAGAGVVGGAGAGVVGGAGAGGGSGVVGAGGHASHGGGTGGDDMGTGRSIRRSARTG